MEMNQNPENAQNWIEKRFQHSLLFILVLDHHFTFWKFLFGIRAAVSI